MSAAAFVLATLLLLSLAGLSLVPPAPRRSAYRNLIAAPIAGSAVLAVAATVLYRFGVPPRTSVLAVAASGGAIGLARLAIARRGQRRPGEISRDTRRDWIVGLVCFAAVFGATVLPHVLGGANFAIFQGNRHDSINYISNAVSYANYPYAELLTLRRDHPPLPIPTLVFGADQLSARPAVAIVYAGLYKLLADEPLAHAYDYCVALQINLYFAVLYVMLALFGQRPIVGHVVAAACAAGFFGQYILDINAWSELLAVPMMVVLAVDVARVLVLAGAGPAEGSPTPAHVPEWVSEMRWGVVRVLALCGGIAFAYPEIGSVAGVISATAWLVACAFALGRGRRAAAWRIAGFCALVLISTAGLAGLYWDGTAGFLLRQLDHAQVSQVDWHRFFQAYLMGRDQNNVDVLAGAVPWSPRYLYAAFSLPVDFASALLGMYFIQPVAGWPYWIRVIWKAVILIGCGAVVVALARSWADLICRRGMWLMSPRRLQARYIVLGATAALAIPAYLLTLGQFWAAGKAVSMLSPFVFVAMVLPIAMARPVARGPRAVLWAVLAAQLLFALYRPYSVGARGDGTHYAAPYPVLSGRLKTEFEWDIARHRDSLARCRLVRVDVDEPFLERAVENVLIDGHLHWYSDRPQRSYYDTGQLLGVVRAPAGEREDCLITTVPPVEGAADTVLWLRRSRRLLDFAVAGGNAGSLDLCCGPGLGVGFAGAYDVEEAGRQTWMWTNGHLSFTVASDRRAPVKRIAFTFGGVSRKRDTAFHVTVNGVPIGDGSTRAGGGVWTIEIPEALWGSDALAVELTSDTFAARNDPRALGVQITSIVASK